MKSRISTRELPGRTNRLLKKQGCYEVPNDLQIRRLSKPGWLRRIKRDTQMAKENPGLAYDRSRGAMTNLGFRLSDQTVANILRHNIVPVYFARFIKN
jgi:hypothetical protein